MDHNRSARHVIDQAILENKIPEYLLYLFSVCLFISGGVLLVIGDNLVIASILEITVLPAMAMTRRFRDRNMALRLMEIPLAHAKTAEEAARALKEVYVTLYNDNSKFSPSVASNEQ